MSEGAEAREEDARGMFRASTGDSRCRVLQNVTGVWGEGATDARREPGVLQNVTGRGVREREAEGLPRPKEKNSRCRSFGEAWATENLGFIGREENRAGRTELMPRFTEACVESGSGQVK